MKKKHPWRDSFSNEISPKVKEDLREITSNLRGGLMDVGGTVVTYPKYSAEEEHGKKEVELVEKYGWDVAWSDEHDAPNGGDYFAYLEHDIYDDEDYPADWISSCQTVEEIYKWLNSEEGLKWRKKIDILRKSKQR